MTLLRCRLVFKNWLLNKCTFIYRYNNHVWINYNYSSCAFNKHRLHLYMLCNYSNDVWHKSGISIYKFNCSNDCCMFRLLSAVWSNGMNIWTYLIDLVKVYSSTVICRFRNIYLSVNTKFTLKNVQDTGKMINSNNLLFIFIINL